MATWFPANPAPIQFTLLANEMVASFIRTTIKAIADDITCVAAALGGVNHATRTLLCAHKGDSLRAAISTEQTPFVLAVARAERVRSPMLRATSELDVSDRSSATALALNLAIHASAEHRSATATSCYGKRARCDGSIEPSFNGVTK